MASRAEVSIKDRWFSSAVLSVSHPGDTAFPSDNVVIAVTRKRTGKLFGVLRGHGSQMPQIALVTHEHDDNVLVGMVAQFLQPSVHVLKRHALADIVDEEGADSTAVVGRGDCAITFLASSIPNLCLDCLGVDLNGSGGKLDADGGLGVEVELVTGESTEKVGLSDARVSDEDHW